MTINLNEAGEQRGFEPIPTGTVVRCAVKIRPGGIGEGGWLTQTTTPKGTSQYLSAELTVLDGTHKGRKIFNNFVVEGEAAGHKEARDISFQTLRAFIESAKGIKPSDKSETAAKARNIDSWSELNGAVVTIKVGVLPAKGDYQAKNTIAYVLTPDQVQWAAPSAEEAAAAQAAATTNTASPQSTTAASDSAVVAKPQWAQ
jgi:hypothetical protein